MSDKDIDMDTDKNDNVKTCENVEEHSIIFSIDNHEEVLRISKDGVYYKGERIDDINNVYERFCKWLDKAEV